MSARLRFLGSSDSQGVPRWWCGCGVCEEARSEGVNARTRPSVLIEGRERVLIDAAPELRLQMTREGVREVDAVLVTHAHSDHVLGLSDIGDQARWTGRTTPVYAPAEVVLGLKERFAYMTRGAYRRLTPFWEVEALRLADYEVKAHRVPHGHNGWSYAFRFDGAGGSWGYMPDCLGLEDLKPWRGLKLLVLGASFFKEDAPLASRSVYDVGEALELLEVLRPERAVLTHLGHGVDAREPAPEGATYARDGLVTDLP